VRCLILDGIDVFFGALPIHDLMRVVSCSWHPRHSFGTTVWKNRLWVVAGSQCDSALQSINVELRLNGTSPSPTATPSPYPTQPAPSDNDPDVWYSAVLDPNDPLPVVLWGEGDIPISFGFEKQGFVLVGYLDWLWALGGAYVVEMDPVNVFEVTNDVYRTPDGVNWEKLPPPPWSPRRKFIAVALSDNKLYVMGGWDTGPSSTVPGQDDDLGTAVAVGVDGFAAPATVTVTASASPTHSVDGSASSSNASSPSKTVSSSARPSVSRTGSHSSSPGSLSPTPSLSETTSLSSSVTPSPSPNELSCQYGDVWVLYPSDGNTSVINDDTPLTWAYVSNMDSFAAYGMAFVASNTSRK
jgi:hypothetical protein